MPTPRMVTETLTKSLFNGKQVFCNKLLNLDCYDHSATWSFLL